MPNGKSISALGFGCSSIWAKPLFDAAEAHNILCAAIDEGLNHLDTGPSYGMGEGEARLGRFLKTASKGNLVITTKVGSNVINGQLFRSFSVAKMMSSFDDSMKRLGVEHVDILYLHGPSVPELNDDVFSFFEQLKRQGRITYSGVNSFDPVVLDAVAHTPIDAVMLQFNVTDQSALPQMQRLAGANKIILSGTALGRVKFDLRALLPTNRTKAWYLMRLLRHEPKFFLRAPRLARQLNAVSASPISAALQYVMGHPLILSNLFGSSQSSHVIANIRAGHGSLSEEQWNRLDLSARGIA